MLSLSPSAALNRLLGSALPYGNAAAVTPNDGANLPNAATRGLYVGVTGDLKVDLIDGGTALVFKAVPVGFFNAKVKKVHATGTTATNILALL